MKHVGGIAVATVVAAIGGCAGALPIPPPIAQAPKPTAACSIAHGEPLVVDWRPEHRADVEVAMRRGVAVVAFDCASIRLLPDCVVDGAYAYAGTTTKEQVLSFRSDEEIRANLPLNGATLAMKMEGELQRGAALDVALVVVGKKTTTWQHVAPADLKGACEGATHFVRSATLGAFVMQSGTRASVRTAVDIFHAGVSASSASAKAIRNQDGSIDDCRRATPDDALPPAQCGALLRLELTAIGTPAAARGDEDPCPMELVFDEGKCADPATLPVHQCKVRHLSDCVAQCEKKHAGSCSRLGWMYLRGEGVAKDEVKGAGILASACDAGFARACFDLAGAYWDGAGVAKDKARAMSLYEKSCVAGEVDACASFGGRLLVGQDVAHDGPRAVALLKTACAGGSALACVTLGSAYERGLGGVERSETIAASLYKQACDGGHAVGCFALGFAYQAGAGVPKDLARAAAIYERGCNGDSPDSCAQLGVLYRAGDGVGRDDVRAAGLFDKACNGGAVASGCNNLAAAYLDGRGVPKDEAKGASLLQRACEAKSMTACGNLANMYAVGVGVTKDLAKAAALYGLACDASLVDRCGDLGAMLVAGEGVKMDRARGVALLQRACNGAVFRACDRLKELGLRR